MKMAIIIVFSCIALYSAIAAIIGYFIPVIPILLAVKISASVGLMVGFLILFFCGARQRQSLT